MSAYTAESRYLSAHTRDSVLIAPRGVQGPMRGTPVRFGYVHDDETEEQ